MAQKTIQIADKPTLDRVAGWTSATISVTTSENTKLVFTDGVTTKEVTTDANGKCIFPVPNRGTWTVSKGDNSDSSVVKVEYNQNYPVRLRGGKVCFGFRKAKNDSNPASRIEYLEDAVGLTPAKMDFTTGAFNYGDWSDVWFVKDNYPCMLNLDGTEAYKLNPNDYSKKVDGSNSDVANTAFSGNAMSAMPLVWLYQYEDSSYEYTYVANYQVNSSFQAYAHTDEDGKIHDYIYMSIYKGYLNGSRLSSISGVQPVYSKTAQQEIDAAELNGKQWYVKTWAQRNLLQCLMTLMFKTTDMQTALGKGNLNYDTSKSPTNGVLKTGTLDKAGQFWGANDNIHQVKAFHQEAVWADQWDRIAGIINNKGSVQVKMIPPYNLNATGYTAAGVTPGGTSGGYINKTKNSMLGCIPTTASGSETTYEADGMWYNNSQVDIALVGGVCVDGSLCGLFALVLHVVASAAAWGFGASLSAYPAS